MEVIIWIIKSQQAGDVAQWPGLIHKTGVGELSWPLQPFNEVIL